MGYILPKKVGALTPYFLDTEDYPIRLDANESFISPPQPLVDSIARAVRGVSIRRYPDPSARALCEAFADYYGVDAANVTAFNGSDEALSFLLNVFCEKGDRILTLSPDFSMYKIYARLAECEVVELPKREDYSVDVDAVIAACRETGCSAIVFSNPCNPTSLGLTKTQVLRIIQNTDALVLLDEAYGDFWDQSLTEQAPSFENVIVLRTCSKMMGLAALRVGFCVANERLTSAMRAGKSPYNMNALSQAAATAVLRQPAYLDACREKLVQSRDALYQRLRGLLPNAYIPKPRTNFALVRTEDAEALYADLKAHGILVRCFEGFLRVTAGSEAEQTALCRQIQSYLAERRERE